MSSVSLKSRYFSIRLLTIAAVGLIFLIASFWLNHAMIKERQSLLRKAKENIVLSWSGSQDFFGPLLLVPYTDHTKKEDSTDGHLIFFPKKLNVAGQALPEIRKRGIFEVLVYESKFDIDCQFACFKNHEDPNKTLLWKQAKIVMCLSDVRGLKEASISIDGKKVDVLSGSEALNKGYPGVHALLTDNYGQTLHVAAQISFRGSEELNITPIAKENQVDLQANWGAPSFIGHFLPSKKEVTNTSFQAQWKVPSLATSLPGYIDLKEFNIHSYKNELKDLVISKSVGVKFLDIADHYQQAERTTKYSFLFVLYTFLLFFLFEVIKKTRIHIFQYCIIACSFLCFSLLLTAFAEHVSFSIAYWTAAALIIGQITFYISSLIKELRERLFFSSFLTVLYAYLFIVMKLEEFALLVGSLGMFLLIFVAMLLTRKVNWFTADE